MQALKATNEMLKSGKVEQVELVQYAGPQCYPQLKERLMANAVESGGVRRDNSRPGAAGVSEDEVDMMLTPDAQTLR